jgi:high-affinity iron transporter
MFAALVIVLREVIEAGLIVGIALAAGRGVPRAHRWIAGGVAVGILGSCVLAIFTEAVASAFEGIGQELFNAAVLALAAVMLAWHNVWMAEHGRQMAAEIRTTGSAVTDGTQDAAALAIVVGAAVLREGAEVVLFLYGIVVTGGETPLALFAGGVTGLLTGVLFAAVIYLGLVRIPLRYLFATTGVLITFLAAGMAAQSVAFLEQAGVVTSLGRTMWDSSWLLSEASLVGRILHTLVGYVDRPTELELLVYLTALAVIFGFGRFVSVRSAQQRMGSA